MPCAEPSSSAEPGERERELDAAALRFDGARVDVRVCVVGVEGDAEGFDEPFDSNGCGPVKLARSDPKDGESSDEPNVPASDGGAGGSSSDG